MEAVRADVGSSVSSWFPVGPWLSHTVQLGFLTIRPVILQPVDSSHALTVVQGLVLIINPYSTPL